MVDVNGQDVSEKEEKSSFVSEDIEKLSGRSLRRPLEKS
ncbi:hypothetical protein ECHHL_0961 [Ehrlichia chaffeensis str. Heartland]|uniref:Uncharacterized protein n=1 Tax=Ehrlichia chaffeensis (strain ATCC CRL-10679 / Arkansas) TaxID=205920 RepID=Q2GHZ5_EHRCR|nr:hypothetical protein ECH_0110 [Ehrlichia chaffeensis str. Arkansas]AHX04090.1 hypothetical protein ECHHL_0961 [Ehrlichia chaffeensis str. Heartland]AHX06023.1 hypothetical protein ECHJAX_0977 [Ehrlichia chaffeensis str. Jax]AHX07013.1 hypothetical protein ECHLIB_0980 [Ehrlichia chaffeensis str. Liberty]AHX07085.1 hypothetical protein ECHOSC_0974 [Ehrlichia chaffeensis str. Osceola]AHX09013.1 hypothetical protein ECHSTV_0965 [Ehrlichia chaffeensis str. Saint Vincent]AHX09961.1 hypothetical 